MDFVALAESGSAITPLVEAFYGPHGPLAQAGWQVRSQQRQMSLQIAAQIDTIYPPGQPAQRIGRPSWGVIEAPCGCHAKGQGILMFDGSIKRVEDVVVGDLLMGPDSNPRTVLSLSRGRERMVDVVPRKGATFRVNRSHILTLARQGSYDPSKRRDRRNGEITDVMVSDIIDRWSQSQKAIHRLVRSGIQQFGGTRDRLDVPPWVLGALLGDGGFGLEHGPTTFTSVDPEVYEEVRDYMLSIRCRWKVMDDRHYLITNTPDIRRNPLRNKLRALGLFPTKCEHKFIPLMYKTASWDERCELLAGLMDTDGSYNGCGGFDYISKSERLSRDVAYVARSLGLAAYVTAAEKWSQLGTGGIYWRVSISGDCSIIPTRLPRKRAPKRVINKNVLRTGFTLVEQDEEDFYGFTLDGDGRFLLDDFTVTHNTGKGISYSLPGLLLAIRQRAEHRAQKALYQSLKQSYDAQIEAGADPSDLPEPIRPPAQARKLIITTANIALQEQLVQKDLPDLARMIGLEDMPIALLKGRNNYICRHRVRMMGSDLLLNPKMRPILDWIDQPGCDGDRERYPLDASEVWGELSVGAEDCLGQSCAHWGKDEAQCFWREAVSGYQDALVIVTNHHYLALVGNLYPGLLAVDEMHELEKSLRSTQARTLTDAAVRGLVARIAQHIGEDAAEDVWLAPTRWLMGRVGEYYTKHQPELPFKTKNPIESPVPLPAGWLQDAEYIAEIVQGMSESIDELHGIACERYGCIDMDSRLIPPSYDPEIPEHSEEAAKLVRAIEQATTLCQRWAATAMGIPDPEWPAATLPWAIYAERTKTKAGGTRMVVSLIPADVSWATNRLSSLYPCAVFTSATIQDFPSLRVALGLTDAPTEAPIPVYETRLDSPYPLAQMGVLVVPHGPSPKDAGWEDWSVGMVLEAVRLARGGTLVLASSTSQMRRYGWELKNEANWTGDFRPRVKVQGDMGRAQLREWFKSDIDGVLVATRSFFQGLDVQGDACRLVIINRVPFARPDDPVENAVQALLVQRSGGGNGYMLRSVPEAAMVLAQGAGRLIRSQQDRGAVLLLDARVMGPGDGWQLLRNALPPFPVSREIQDIENLLQGHPLIGVAPPPRATARRRI